MGRRSRYLELFVQEATEHLEAMGRLVLELEGAGLEPGRIDELFRLAHSIKGSAAAIDLVSITALAHELEEIFTRLRGRTGAPPGAVVELLAAATGRLEAMVAAAARGEPIPDPAELIARIRGLDPGGAPDAPPPAAPPAASAPRISGTTRVRTEALDRLLDEASELVFAVARLREKSRALADADELERALAALQGRVKNLHSRVLGVRLTPISILTERLQRMTRALGKSLGKDVELQVEGAETELDRSILDELADPLGHLVRNCVHHGIEAPMERAAVGKPLQGRVRLRIRRKGERASIMVEDDGRGLDEEALRRAAVAAGVVPADASLPREQALRLCLHPGVSTAGGVTDVSGRGVGMDAVARAVERLGGSIAIRSATGEGAAFELDVPLGAAVAPVLLVGAGNDVLALPLSQVVAATHEDAATRAAIELAGDPTPRYHLSALLDPDSPPERRFPMFGTPRPCVLVETGVGQVALHVDRLVGYEEAVLRPLAPPLDRAPGVAGATLLATGTPVFVLDVRRLLEAAGVPRG
ncbi:MAG TPA: Hpt domain-containing protein [Vulgatibacter sp.]|nr:Hpt domain-containing protein [Vulgatibacter sp.]